MIMSNQTIVKTNGKESRDEWDFIRVVNLVKHFPVRGGFFQKVVAWVQAVDNVSFSIREGETVGLVAAPCCA
jgi:ABC-type oligopeptide transport system ATPase subunit